MGGGTSWVWGVQFSPALLLIRSRISSLRQIFDIFGWGYSCFCSTTAQTKTRSLCLVPCHGVVILCLCPDLYHSASTYVLWRSSRVCTINLRYKRYRVQIPEQTNNDCICAREYLWMYTKRNISFHVVSSGKEQTY